MNPSTLHIEARGLPQDPAVLLLHGLLGASRNLRRLSDAIAAQGFYVITYDQRGHGHSPWAPEYTLEMLAHDAVAVLDEKNIKKAHFIGHSMGGRVCLATSGIAPQRQMSLAMLDVGPHISAEALAELRETLDPLPLFFSSKAEAEATLAHHDLALRQFLMSNLRSAGAEQELKWVFDLEGLRKSLLQNIKLDQSELLRRISVPTLMLRGERSEHFKAHELEYAQGLNSKIQTKTIAHAGHWLHVDNFDGTAKALIQWLSIP